MKGKYYSAKYVTVIPVNYVFLHHGFKSQVTDMNHCKLSENY